MTQNKLKGIEEFISQRLLSLVERGAEKYSNQTGYANQAREDIAIGFVKKGGLYVPLNSVDYRILFDHYESMLIEAFLALARSMLESKASPFVAFAFRTIQEIGITRLNVLLSPQVAEEQRKLIKLLSIFCNWIALPEDTYKKQFCTLLSEEGKIVKSQGILAKLERTKENMNNGKDSQEELVYLRKKLNILYEEQRTKVEDLPIVDERLKNRIMYGWWSHLLHGDPLLIKDALNPTNSQQTYCRLLGCVWLSGVNIANRLAEVVEDKKYHSELKRMNNEAESHWTGLVSIVRK